MFGYSIVVVFPPPPKKEERKELYHCPVYFCPYQLPSFISSSGWVAAPRTSSRGKKPHFSDLIHRMPV